MGEVLRAIMDKNCTYSQPAFYSLSLAITSTVTGNKVYSRRQTSLACKTDVYFLALGAAQFAYFNGASGHGVAPRSEPTTFMLQRGANQENYAQFPQVKINQNQSLNNWSTFDEYVLFSPAELMTVVEDVQTGDQANVFTHTTVVTVLGIEYAMPSGKGNPYGY